MSRLAVAFERMDRSLKVDPNRYVKFRSRLHDQKVAAVLGVALGVCFFTCFVTGMVSHIMQHPPSWYAWPSRPVGFYRATQGLHVATGLFMVPILFAKLWVVYPKLFQFPPVRNVAETLERVSLLPLIGGGLFQIVTGIANTYQWYFFRFFFTTTHYAVAWITIGALVVHIGAKWSITRSQLLTRMPSVEPVSADTDGLTRRGFLFGVFGTSALVTTFSVGQTFTPLGRIAFLTPRRPGVGPQMFPVNKSAVVAGITETATSPDYRLNVDGNVATPLVFSLAELQALPQSHASLPIACVEGWSQSARWSGVRVRDLVAMAGGRPGSSVRVESLEQNSIYAQSVLNRYHAGDPDTLLALELNGEQLHIDHGYPCRLIGPNRPGVLQTKWVHRLVVL